MDIICTWEGPCDDLFLFAFPFLFAGMWFFIMGLLAWLGGWTTLAAKYAIPDRMPEGRLNRWHSGVLKKSVPASYSNCLNITITPDGLGLSMMLIFSFRHTPFFIPWSDMELTEGKRWIFKKIDLAVRDTGVTISFWSPKVIETLTAAYNAYHNARKR